MGDVAWSLLLSYATTALTRRHDCVATKEKSKCGDVCNEERDVVVNLL
jgi:hypothetical protein